MNSYCVLLTSGEASSEILERLFQVNNVQCVKIDASEGMQFCFVENLTSEQVHALETAVFDVEVVWQVDPTAKPGWRILASNGNNLSALAMRIPDRLVNVVGAHVSEEGKFLLLREGFAPPRNFLLNAPGLYAIEKIPS